MLNNGMKEVGILEQLRGLQAVQTLLNGDREMEKKGWIRGEKATEESGENCNSEFLTWVKNDELKFCFTWRRMRIQILLDFSDITIL